jgi:DNA-binding beta-propeller fold protein YncE
MIRTKLNFVLIVFSVTIILLLLSNNLAGASLPLLPVNFQFVEEISLEEEEDMTQQSTSDLCNFHSVKKFDSNGNFIRSLGSDGSGKAQFSNRIEDINIDSSDYVYVVDYGNNRISKFDSNGNFLTMWGTKGAEEGQFNRP